MRARCRSQPAESRANSMEDGRLTSPSFPVKRIPGDRQEDDQPLNGFFPLRRATQESQVGIRAQKDKGRRDRAQQGDTDCAAGQGAAAAGNGHPPYHDGRDDLKLQASA